MAIDGSGDGGIVEVNMDADVVPEAQLRASHIPQHHVPSLGFIGTLIEVYILLKSGHLPLSVMWALS